MDKNKKMKTQGSLNVDKRFTDKLFIK